MATSRSRFYVDTPLGRDPPTQRHSMYVSHSAADGSPKQDLSNASSSSTLPSTAGSVDRLTGLGEKKKSPRFFTLKPKTSFSLRPFFSSTSISSLSPSKRRRETATPRQDSYVQTDEDVRAFDEVGVQTLNASTVDVPVQTCFREWDEGDIYSYGRRSYSAGAYRPTYQRWSPSAGYSSSSRPSTESKSTATAPEDPAKGESSFVTPLAPAKLLKYSVPGDSPTRADKSSTKSSVNSGVTSVVPQTVAVASSVPITTNVPVKYFAAKELTSYPTQPTKPLVESSGDKSESKPSGSGSTISASAVCDDFQSSKQTTPKQVVDSVKSEAANSSSAVPIRKEGDKKPNDVPEVSKEISNPVLPPTDRPPSALKVERTDSPKVNKSVHFVLSDLDSDDTVPKKEIEPINPRNLDKDFEALLRDLDILTDDPPEQSFSPSAPPFKCPLSPTVDNPPKQTILSANLKSVFDSLNHDILPAILENADEVSEVDFQVDDSKSGNDETNTECDSKKSNLNSISSKLEESKCPSPTPELNEEERKFTDPKDGSLKFTSATVFTATKLDLDAEHDGKPESVYDSGIKESTLKTVLLPTLPSFFDTHSGHTQPAVHTVVSKEIGLPVVLESLDKDKMLSRSSSRSSVRSNSRTEFFDVSKKFDSCENLDQLEEEIIRSLCTPNEENFENVEMNQQVMPNKIETHEDRNVDASQIRRAILDRLLSGDSGEEIAPTNSCIVNGVTLLPESKVNPKVKTKYVATLTKFESHDNDIPSKSEFLPRQCNYNSSSGAPVYSHVVTPNDQCPPFSEKYENPKFLQQSSSVLLYPTANLIETSKNNSVFLFPENNQLSAGVPDQATVVTSMESLQGKTLFTPLVSRDGHLNNLPLQTSENNPDREIVENNIPSSDLDSRTCDFTNCLRPSKLQNSPFLEQISARSTTPRTTPDPSFTQSSVPVANTISVESDKNTTQVQKTNGQCDYASCLKPSQVQNSMFTAELSELTANKSSTLSGDLLRTNSPLTARTNSPVWTKSNSLDRSDAKQNCKRASEDHSDPEVRHKSEVTIILKTPQPNKFIQAEEGNAPGNGRIPHIHNPAIPNLDTTPQAIQSELEKVTECSPNPGVPHPSAEESVPQVPFAIPPPPPPPPPSNHVKENNKNNDNNTVSLESMIKNQHSNLTKQQEPCGTRSNVSKSAIMIELEKRFESPRRNSSEGPHLDKLDRNCDLRSERKTDNSPVPGSENSFDSSFVNHSPVTAVPYKCNGSNGFSIDQRERSSSLPNGKHENGLFKNDPPYSAKTILTDAPPPPGAVLLEKKVTVEGNQVHTDKYYAIPVKEVTKERTTTTKFVPAPPKYEGIGPTEDGVPIGLRNSVKKENMHNWYKTMFKSLHKADSANDAQEYVIGYSSEPETTRTERIMRKKSATLDNRSGHNNSTKNIGNLQGYPPSAKSSIEVYNVRPRLIEDYEPGHSSVTDDEITYCSTRYLPPLKTPKPLYEFKNGYEQENNFIRNLEKPEAIRPEEQKVWYKDIQKGGDIPQFGLGKPAPERPKEPVIGPLPPPPLNYNGPSILQQATRPLTLPANYCNQNDNGLCQQPNGPYEVHMRQVIHTELQQRISPSPSQLSSPTRSILKSPSRSPDLKIPARALFDFKAESAKEIAFKRGDMVLILRQLDKNWYEGEYKGNIGIFPISYVEIVPPEHVSTPSKAVVEGIGKVMFDFTAQTSVELSLKKGDAVNLLRRVDSNWYEARFNNKKGIVPVSYLQVLQEPEERNVFSPKPCIKSPTLNYGSLGSPYNANSKPSSPCIVNSTSPSVDNSRSKLQTRGKKGSNLIEPVMYKAIYSYNPQNTDELELLEGDIVCVVEMCDDGWYVGTSVRTGVFGIFPGNYVEKV